MGGAIWVKARGQVWTENRVENDGGGGGVGVSGGVARVKGVKVLYALHVPLM